MASVSVWFSIMLRAVTGSRPKRRMERQAPSNAQRRNNRVDARAVGQASVHHGRRFIDPPAHAGNDALDDLHEVLVVFERQASQFQLARALNVNPVIAVDQNVGDGVVFEQRLERAEAENFVEDFARQPLALGKAERNDLAVDRIPDEDKNFFTRCISSAAAQFFQIKTVENLAMQVRLYLLVFAALEGLQIGHKILYGLKQRPRGAFHIDIVASQFVRQPGKTTGNLGVTLFHHRRSPVDGR